jgi:hypothetical protein
LWVNFKIKKSFRLKLVSLLTVSRFSVLESSWDGNCGAQADRSTTRHGDLGTFSIELWDTSRTRLVDSKRLDAEEIIAVRDKASDVERADFYLSSANGPKVKC